MTTEEKAAKWDALFNAVYNACFTLNKETDEYEDNKDSDLCTIGEIAAIHLGIM